MIVVTTPSGRIASQVIPLLIKAGEEVRVIARNPSKLSEEIRNRVEVVHGSMNDSATLNSALKGADGLFWILPPPFRADNLSAYVKSFSTPLVEALTLHKVSHIVGISSLGRELGREAGLASLLHDMDSAIESTDANYRALWCPGFMENTLLQVEAFKKTNTLFLTTEPDQMNPLVATADIAQAAAEMLSDRSWEGKGGIAMLGPENLSPLDMVAVLSKVLDREIRYQRISFEAYRAQLLGNGASDAFAQGAVQMSIEIANGLYQSPSLAENAHTPTSFHQWCMKVLVPAVRS